MLSLLKEQLKDSLTTSLKKFFPSPQDIPSIDIEIPNDKSHGEFSSNIALKSTKILKRPPLDVAREFRDAIQKGLESTPLKTKIDRVDVKKPGFINFYLSTQAVYDILYQVFEQKDQFGSSQIGKGKKIQIEFVSANPTGPLSVAHARQAAVGDSLANILNFLGFHVQREYYVNDEGNQILILGQSIKCRAAELLGCPCEFPQEGYQGEYIRDMAQEFINDQKIKDEKQLNGLDLSVFTEFGVDYLMSVIKKDLDDFGVHFDIWTHQSKVASQDKIETLIKTFQDRGYCYEKDGAIWFKSTEYGDDKDRVVKKSDGNYTYLTPDMVYHKNKFDRGFEKIINIWGPDHHGYIPRLTAAVEALGQKRDALKILIVQLATIYRAGKPVLMSTRRGQYISLREVIDEVGADAARYFFLMRHTNVHLDFDLEVAKKETPENPVYYIQYAHARIHSIGKKAKEANLQVKTSDIALLKEAEELDLIKQLGNFPDMLLICLQQTDPFALVSYMQELAACFHRFYDCHKVVDPDNPELSAQRLALIDAVRIVLANGLTLLGTSAPKRM